MTSFAITLIASTLALLQHQVCGWAEPEVATKADSFFAEGDTIRGFAKHEEEMSDRRANLMRTRTSDAKAAVQIESGGDTSSKEREKSAAPDFAEHQQGKHLMRPRKSKKDAVQIDSGDTSNQVWQDKAAEQMQTQIMQRKDNIAPAAVSPEGPSTKAVVSMDTEPAEEQDDAFEHDFDKLQLLADETKEERLKAETQSSLGACHEHCEFETASCKSCSSKSNCEWKTCEHRRRRRRNFSGSAERRRDPWIHGYENDCIGACTERSDARRRRGWFR